MRYVANRGSHGPFKRTEKARQRFLNIVMMVLMRLVLRLIFVLLHNLGAVSKDFVFLLKVVGVHLEKPANQNIQYDDDLDNDERDKVAERQRPGHVARLLSKLCLMRSTKRDYHRIKCHLPVVQQRQMHHRHRHGGK